LCGRCWNKTAIPLRGRHDPDSCFCFFFTAFILISWPVFRNPRRHGFGRFFLWEADLALILIQAPVWLSHPWAWNQLLAWLFFAGFGTLKKKGKAQGHFENTTALVTDGIYRYIRHPMWHEICKLLKKNSWLF
jgi:hypothetical protein